MKSKTVIRIYLTSILGILSTLMSTGQGSRIGYDLFSQFEKGNLEVVNREISSFSEEGKKGISFSKKQNDGIAWLKGVEFSDGTIDIDIRGKDLFQQSFVGIAFHGIDSETLDAIYFRPFNFQSPDPVRKIHAVQYVSHPDNTWAALRDKHNGIYEKAVSPAPGGNDWFHATIEISYPHISVYINGNSEPSLRIDKLNERKTGRIGLWVGNNSDGDFANLVLTHGKPTSHLWIH